MAKEAKFQIQTKPKSTKPVPFISIESTTSSSTIL